MYEFLTPIVWLSLQLWPADQLSSGKYTAGGAFELYGCCGTKCDIGHEYLYLSDIPYTQFTTLLFMIAAVNFGFCISASTKSTGKTVSVVIMFLHGIATCILSLKFEISQQ